MNNRIPKEIRDGSGVPSMCGPKANPSRRGLLLSDVNVVTDNSVALKNALLQIKIRGETIRELHRERSKSVLVPVALAEAVLGAMSKQMVSEPVRELLALIEGEL